jgi:hypothetical protein
LPFLYAVFFPFFHNHSREDPLTTSQQALGVRVLIAFLGLFTDLKSSGWDDEIMDGVEFLEHSVLQLPFFLMSFMRYISPSLDNM